MFEKLEGTDKQSNVFVDEIYVKPGVQFQGGRLKGFCDEEPKNQQKLFSTYGSVTHGTTKSINIMLQLGLFIYDNFMCDNLKFNQNMIPQIFIPCNIK